MLCSHFLLVFLFCEHRIDWNPTHRNLCGGYPEGLKVDACFLDHDKIMLVMVDQPHRVDVEVGDDYYLTTRETFLCFQPRHDFGRKKVRTNNQVRLVIAQQFNEGTRVEFVEREPAAF